MKDQNKAVWIGVEHLTNDPVLQENAASEFAQMPIEEVAAGAMSLEASRRDFLKYLGFGIGAATLAASCDIPVKKAIPFVVKPDTIVPGIATYYASSFVNGGDYCPVLVKTRDGRPIKIEGNTLSKVTLGGTSARAQASVLSLYDTSRLDGPYRISGGKVDRPAGKRAMGPSWAEIDKEISSKLNANSRVRILSNTVLSPTTKKAIADFSTKFPNTTLVQYDPVSASALLEANALCFGQAVVPGYRFDRANVILSFDADFLGTWISPIEFAAQYTVRRRITDVKKANLSRHIQVESHMTLTGSNADNRILVKPSEQGAAIVALYNAVAAATGKSSVSGPALNGKAAQKIKAVANELLANRGTSLVVAGSNNIGEQVLVNAINDALGNYGATIDFAEASFQRQGRDSAVRQLVREMNAGQVDALFVLDGANPAYDLPDAAQFAQGLSKVKLKVSFSAIPNETAVLCDYLAPNSHYLESWGDAEPKRGHYSLQQPTINPIFAALGRPGTRQAEESLLRWAASEMLNVAAEQPYMEYLKAHWEQNFFRQQSKYATFQSFWDSTLHDGVFEAPQLTIQVAFSGDVNAAAAKVRKPVNAELEISFFETVNMAGGQYANNPWLQEMPDPVTRCSWGNYLAIPVVYEGGNEFTSFKNLNREEAKGKADIVEVDVNGKKSACTVVRQFGQFEGTLGLAIGYGRNILGRMGNALGQTKVGVNVYPWLSIDADGQTQYYATKVAVSDRVDVDTDFACVQYHHTMGVTARDDKGQVMTDPSTGKPLNVDEKAVMTIGSGFQGSLTERSVIFQGNAKDLEKLAHHIEEKRAEAEHLNSQTLYPYETYKKDVYGLAHHWNMHVDLNACIGCGACQVACIAENNVPVVGKIEVSRHHEMAWIRIDRYFFGDYENPNVVYQPMMCQHCDNAPCENVCPVAATNHSSEGLNQMTYNRCIGTRYCANNCPYKVRRFNWLDYTTADLFGMNENPMDDEYMYSSDGLPYYADNLTRMVLNPDVTVRSRGVIEKCSFCVQRIQEGKLTAKREGRALMESDVKSACQTACPTGAIVFGDRNNKENELSKRLASPLNYLVLEEVNTRSSVNYAARVVNRDEALDA